MESKPDKQRRKLEKHAARQDETRRRIAARAAMHGIAQEKALGSFDALMTGGSLLPAWVPVAVQLQLPLWDTDRLKEDALSLLALFPPERQYGDLHGGMWRTLCLRSTGGALDDDSPAPLGCYASTIAWHRSTYIVPCVLQALARMSTSEPGGSGCSGLSELGAHAAFKFDDASGGDMDWLLQRVRLSVIPPGCNVAWHTDYEATENVGPIRLHIPLICSDTFSMDIGGR